MSNYESLEVWKVSHEFVLRVYKKTANFPLEEKYGLVSQLRRAAASIPTNIAEGKGSSYNKKLSRFLDIAKGSAQEVDYLLLLCKDLGYLDIENYKNLKNDCIRIIQMLTKFKAKIDKSSQKK